jgi:hypothetical protein
MVEAKFSLDKVVLALPKIISGFFNAIESSVKSVLRTADAAKAGWTVGRLEKLNIFLNKVMVGPAGLRHAVTQYCDDPTPEHWGLIAIKLDESAAITKGFRKMIDNLDQKFAAKHSEVLQAMEQSLFYKDGWRTDFARTWVKTPTSAEEIAELRASMNIFDEVNKAVESVQAEVKTYIGKLEKIYRGTKTT